MRTTRALIAGLGTTGSLVAAAACVFLVASAVIAFKGWPGTGFTDRIDNLFVTDEPPVAWDRPGTQAVAAGAGTAAGAVAATPAGPTFGTPGLLLAADGGSAPGPVPSSLGELIGGGGAGTGGGGGGGGATGGSGGGGGGGGVPGVDTGGAQNTLADTVQRTGGSVGGAVRDTTGSVGNTVGGPAGGAVTQTGNTVGNTVDSTTQTAGDLLRP